MVVSSVPGVVEIVDVVGPEARGGPELVLEVAHGATRSAEFHALAARLRGPFPPGLDDFFHVNTDAGAPELALAVAEAYVAARPSARALVLRAQIPRTFVDVNRILDASPEAYRAGGVTPGMPPYVRDAGDKAVLRELHASYVAAVGRVLHEVCGNGGQALLLHTYAPVSVEVEVDDDIGPALRRAYEPEQYGRWRPRPEVDLITRRPDGTSVLAEHEVAALRALLHEVGLPLAEGATYPLHPSTQAAAYAEAWPGRVLCMEVRRDLLADPFEPFAQMTIAPARVAPIAQALATWLSARGAGETA